MLCEFFLGGGRTSRTPPSKSATGTIHVYVVVHFCDSMRYFVFERMFVCLMVFNTTFNNISVISWRSVLLVEETRGPGEHHRHVTDKHYHIMFYTSPWSRFEFTTSVVIGTDCIVGYTTTIRSRPRRPRFFCFWKEVNMCRFVYICIAVGDPVIKRGRLG